MIRIKTKIKKAEEEDCIDKKIKRLEVIANETHFTIRVSLRPFEIKTIRLYAS